MHPLYGSLAQLARAPRLHRGGRGFEPLATHQKQKKDPKGLYFVSVSFTSEGREPAGFVRARSRGEQKCLHFYLRGDAANQGSARSRCPSRPTRPRKDARGVFFVSRKNLKRDIIHLSLRRVPLALKRPTFCNRSDAMQKHKTRYTLGISI